ncbi:MAG: glycosyl transferase [Oscillospiraceae bacterium]|nr:glycosyl transferase [Candidatus Equicaccousia limihippi]
MAQNLKHAYLIIAHKNDFTFYTLLSMLDDRRNDIFIHMNKKNKDFSPSDVYAKIEKSNVYFIKRMSVTWGGYSQIKTEVRLLAAATKQGQYAYYHLLSGEDLPIKSQDYIHKYLSNNVGTEYVGLSEAQEGFEERMGKYYFFQDKLGRRTGNMSFMQKIYSKLDGFSRAVQAKLKIKRNVGIHFAKGSNWFSITDGLARDVVSKRRFIKKTFKYTVCGDEEFLQTIVINSEKWREKAVGDQMRGALRLIDWERGRPYIFRSEDYDLITKSDMLFARKFNAETDKEIIEKVRDYVGQ